MLNNYPLWKYIILVLTMIIGILFALPNLYGEDPAIQITGTHGNNINDLTLIQVRNILEQQHIDSKSVSLENDIILVRCHNLDTQLHAQESLLNTLGKDYIVSLSLVPAAPAWLTRIGAMPMNLGLDLRGGVHFLIEVDMNTMINNLQEQKIDILRNDLRKKGIIYSMVRKINDYSKEIYFRNSNERDEAILWLNSHYKDEWKINNIGDNAIIFTLNDNILRQASEYAIQQNINILRKRINQLGIIEPLVQRQGSNRIVIELPGIQDTVYAKEILGATATVEFRLVNSSIKQFTTNNLVPIDSEIKSTVDGRQVMLYKQIILTGNHIINSTYDIDEYNRPQVNIFLDRKGSTIISNFTKNNIGKLMATLFVEYKNNSKRKVNDHNVTLEKKEEVINIATIKSQLSNNFRITGFNNLKEAQQLSLLLRAGALIAPIYIVEERTIGPTLGLQNIKQGLKACLWGLITSIIFMVVWYRKFGLIAIIALIANLILIIGIMSVLPGMILTMPGIAGIVLTLAVAVDANVLINERIKEELRNGRTFQQAIYEGYKGAFSSIFDASVTTLITAIILYVIGTGPIKGFAITTMIGIITSMFTTIIGTRAIINLIYGGKRINNLSI